MISLPVDAVGKESLFLFCGRPWAEKIKQHLKEDLNHGLHKMQKLS